MKAYAKTGTSSESNDLWMVAGSPYYVGSVWYGFDLQSKVDNGAAAATIWKEVMKDVHKNLEKKEFEDSEDVVKKGIGYYKKNGRMDNPIYQNNSSSSSQGQVSSAVSSNTSSVTSSDSSTSSQEPTESTVTEPSTPPESSTPSVPEKPSEPPESSEPSNPSKPSEPSSSSSSSEGTQTNE